MAEQRERWPADPRCPAHREEPRGSEFWGNQGGWPVADEGVSVGYEPGEAEVEAVRVAILEAAGYHVKACLPTDYRPEAEAAIEAFRALSPREAGEALTEDEWQAFDWAFRRAETVLRAEADAFPEPATGNLVHLREAQRKLAALRSEAHPREGER